MNKWGKFVTNQNANLFGKFLLFSLYPFILTGILNANPALGDVELGDSKKVPLNAGIAWWGESHTRGSGDEFHGDGYVLFWNRDGSCYQYAKLHINVPPSFFFSRERLWDEFYPLFAKHAGKNCTFEGEKMTVVLNIYSGIVYKLSTLSGGEIYIGPPPEGSFVAKIGSASFTYLPENFPYSDPGNTSLETFAPSFYDLAGRNGKAKFISQYIDFVYTRQEAISLLEEEYNNFPGEEFDLFDVLMKDKLIREARKQADIEFSRAMWRGLLRTFEGPGSSCEEGNQYACVQDVPIILIK